MTIKAGDQMPAGKFKVATAEGLKDLTTEQLFEGRNVLFFAVPGAFTPTCDASHLPGYVENWPTSSAPRAWIRSPACRSTTCS